MIARCVGTRGHDAPQYLGVLFFDLTIDFGLKLGGLYTVLGMEIYKGLLQILVPDDSDLRRPQWLPLDLFAIEDARMPPDWYFQAYAAGTVGRERGFHARWGYRELVESDGHRDGLEDLDSNALSVFTAQLEALEAHGDC